MSTFLSTHFASTWWLRSRPTVSNDDESDVEVVSSRIYFIRLHYVRLYVSWSIDATHDMFQNWKLNMNSHDEDDREGHSSRQSSGVMNNRSQSIQRAYHLTRNLNLCSTTDCEQRSDATTQLNSSVSISFDDD